MHSYPSIMHPHTPVCIRMPPYASARTRHASFYLCFTDTKKRKHTNQANKHLRNGFYSENSCESDAPYQILSTSIWCISGGVFVAPPLKVFPITLYGDGILPIAYCSRPPHLQRCMCICLPPGHTVHALPGGSDRMRAQ